MTVIRDYQPEDLGTIKKMVEAEYGRLTNEVIDGLKDWRSQVYEQDGEAIGFVSVRQYKTDYGLRIYVAPQHRGKGIGTRLWEHIQPAFSGEGPDDITATYLVDQGGGPQFFGRRGFRPWYQMENLSYRGARFETPALAITPYQDDFFDTYIRILGDSFCEMRRAHDFKPFNVYESENTESNRADMASRSGDFFLAWDRAGIPVGCGSVQGDFIDTVGVIPQHQGKGYGKALTQFCVNLILNRGHVIARTSVVQDNKPARDLYYRLGFEHDLTEEHSVLKGASHD